jgi:hypothetical protein
MSEARNLIIRGRVLNGEEPPQDPAFYGEWGHGLLFDADGGGLAYVSSGFSRRLSDREFADRGRRLLPSLLAKLEELEAACRAVAEAEAGDLAGAAEQCRQALGMKEATGA